MEICNENLENTTNTRKFQKGNFLIKWTFLFKVYL